MMVAHCTGAHASALSYDPASINRTCKYAVLTVPPDLFYNATVAAGFMFPLDSATAAATAHASAWQACWGPGEAVSTADMVAGRKLPCYYSVAADGRSIDYWEENACDTVLKVSAHAMRAVYNWHKKRN